MKFVATPLQDAWIIEIEPRGDERGFLARAWCAEEFASRGLNPHLVQCNITFTKKKGTLRGMHYQTAPYEEAKLVRCTRGAIYDVILDLRPKSPTFKQWFAATLTADNRTMLYIPEGFAHGLQTLTNDTEVFYQMSETYHPESATGVRWNDAAFGIEWPEGERTIAPRDQEYSDFQ